MNIHFTDKNLFEKLKEAALVKCSIGSYLYGTQTKSSDKDFLYIYATSEAELKSFVWTNHQLQYNEDGIDHNFVSLHTFVRNIINGDSTVNFEIVHSEELKCTLLDFLYEHRNSFNTYTMIRSYLGFAKRDTKHFSRCNTDYEKRKKIEHIIRGYIIASNVLDDTFNFEDIRDLLKDIMSRAVTNISTVKNYIDLIDRKRLELNRMLDDKTLVLPKILDVQNGKTLEESMKIIQNTVEYKYRQSYLQDFDMSIFIEAFENWVSYEKQPTKN